MPSYTTFVAGFQGRCHSATTMWRQNPSLSFAMGRDVVSHQDHLWLKSCRQNRRFTNKRIPTTKVKNTIEPMQKKTPLEYSIKLQEVSLYEERMLLKSDNKPINPIKSEQNYSKKSKCLKMLHVS